MLSQPIHMIMSGFTLLGAMLAALQVSIFSTIPSESALTASLDTSPSYSQFGSSDALSSSGKYRVNRSPDGLFYVDGQINNVPIKFAVDTGASVVVLNANDAERTGLKLEQTATHRIRTAGGYSAMRWSKTDKFSVAGKKFEEIDIAVMEGGPKTSLLGLNALSHFETVTIKKNQLIIE